MALLRVSAILLLIFTVLTGLAYPAAVTGVAQAVFPHQANGSLIESSGTAAGSALIGQQFSAPRYFWGRLSATAPYPYDAAASSGSNLGPSSPALVDAAKQRIAALKRYDPTNTAPVPVDLVTASASGLDPDVSVAAALYQVHRVAQARGLPDSQVQALVDRYTQGRALGIFGEPHVNVLKLNLALDGLR